MAFVIFLNKNKKILEKLIKLKKKLKIPINK